MSITDKLYESIAKKCWHVLDANGYYELLAIADRIDEQHRKTLENMNELQELYAKAQEDRERMFRACVEKNQTILRLCDEKAKLRDELDFCLKHVPNCDGCEAMLDCDECLRADSSQKERKRFDYENEKLRELVRELLTDPDAWDYDYFKYRMRELGIER